MRLAKKALALLSKAALVLGDTWGNGKSLHSSRKGALLPCHGLGVPELREVPRLIHTMGSAGLSSA